MAEKKLSDFIVKEIEDDIKVLKAHTPVIPVEYVKEYIKKLQAHFPTNLNLFKEILGSDLTE